MRWVNGLVCGSLALIHDAGLNINHFSLAAKVKNPESQDQQTAFQEYV